MKNDARRDLYTEISEKIIARIEETATLQWSADQTGSWGRPDSICFEGPPEDPQLRTIDDF